MASTRVDVRHFDRFDQPSQAWIYAAVEAAAAAAADRNRPAIDQFLTSFRMLDPRGGLYAVLDDFVPAWFPSAAPAAVTPADKWAGSVRKRRRARGR